MATENEKKRLHPVNIRLDWEMRDELRELAKQENRPLANYIVTVLKEHLATKKAEREANK
jgi:predicted DNA-binding protein